MEKLAFVRMVNTLLYCTFEMFHWTALIYCVPQCQYVSKSHIIYITLMSDKNSSDEWLWKPWVTIKDNMFLQRFFTDLEHI